MNVRSQFLDGSDISAEKYTMHQANLINDSYSAEELKFIYPDYPIPEELSFLNSQKPNSDFQAVLIDAFAPIDAQVTFSNPFGI